MTWVKHHAWLVIPVREKDPKAVEQARVRSLPEDSPYLDHPPIQDDGGLLAWLEEVGWCEWGEGGARGLTWSEWQAWQGLTQAEVAPWQARLLFALSNHFAIAASAAREESTRPYWEPAEVHDEDQRERQRLRILAAFGAVGA